MKNPKIKSTKSKGNVFEDLGFEKTEAANLLVRADLMIEIDRFIKEKKMRYSRRPVPSAKHPEKIVL